MGENADGALETRADASITLPALSGAVKPSLGHPVVAYLSNLAPGSRRGMEQVLRLAGSLLLGQPDAPDLVYRVPWHLLRRQHLMLVRAAMERTHRPGSINKTLSAMRGVLHECWCNESMATDDYRRAIDVKSLRDDPLPRGRALTQDELRKVILACLHGPAPWGVRDAALVATLYGSGVRRAEAAKLHLQDYDPATGAVTVTGGKGRKDGVSYIGPALRRYLDAWLHVRGDWPGPIFVPIAASGNPERRSLSPGAILFVMKRRAADGGIAEFSVHDLRRTFVSDLLQTADLSVCARLCRHSSIRTTARYDRRGEQSKQKAVEALQIDMAPAPVRRLGGR